jgi:hypothetical protein
MSHEAKQPPLIIAEIDNAKGCIFTPAYLWLVKHNDNLIVTKDIIISLEDRTDKLPWNVSMEYIYIYIRCIMSQKSSDVICIVEEAWKHAHCMYFTHNLFLNYKNWICADFEVFTCCVLLTSLVHGAQSFLRS